MSGRLPVPPFEAGLHTSPYTLFRQMLAGEAPRLVDVRHAAARSATFATAERWPGGDWPYGDQPVVLFDDDGLRATSLARMLQEDGALTVRALYGGLRLYDHALDPQVVGQERFLMGARNVQTDQVAES